MLVFVTNIIFIVIEEERYSKPSSGLSRCPRLLFIYLQILLILHHVVPLTEGAAVKISVRHQPSQLLGAAVSQEDGVDEQAQHVRDRVPHPRHEAREGVGL